MLLAFYHSQRQDVVWVVHRIQRELEYRKEIFKDVTWPVMSTRTMRLYIYDFVGLPTHGWSYIAQS